MTIENHPLLRDYPELADQLVSKAMADDDFAQRAQHFATLDSRVQSAAANADETAEHAALARELVEDLKKPVASSCCGGCGGGGH